MKSLQKQASDAYERKMNKKGQTITKTISGTVLGIMVLIFIIFAVLFGISALNPGSFFSTASAEQNATNNLQRNLTAGVDSFGKYIPTVLLILGVVFALVGILLLIAYVKRMDSVGGSGGGGL